MLMKQIGVVGAGQMGSGIAQVAAQAGFTVWLYDVAAEACQKGIKTIEKSLQKFVEKGKLSGDQLKTILARIQTTTHLNELKDCDLVIEAAPETIELKQNIFSMLSGIVKKEAILATNTSSIAIAKIAAETKQPENVIGLHL